MEISTGDQVGVAITIVQNPISNQLHLFVALGNKVNRYRLPDGQPTGSLEVGDNINAITVNAMVDQLAVGCEDGSVKVYKVTDDKMESDPVYNCDGHQKAVCALAFSPREQILVSSAKDGTARVWKQGQSLGVLKCSVADPRAPPPTRAVQVLVRGCAFGDLNGKLIYTIASGRRGKAYLSKWGFNAASKKYECMERTECSPCPISAMSLSGDAGLLALGAVDGTIILWGVDRWKPLKLFREVHDLPVTCIAARPFPLPLQGEEDGVQFHALSASADSQLAWLSLQRPQKSKASSRGSGSLKGTVNSLVRIMILGWILYPVANEIWEKCEEDWDNVGYAKTWECIRYDALLAPTSRPGILVPPH